MNALGVLLDGYQNYFKTIASIISLLLGKFSYSQFENTNPVLGPIFFFGFNIMVNWIVMNMLISILNDVFAIVRTNLEFQNNDYEMVDFMTESFKGFFLRLPFLLLYACFLFELFLQIFVLIDLRNPS